MGIGLLLLGLGAFAWGVAKGTAAGKDVIEARKKAQEEIDATNAQRDAAANDLVRSYQEERRSALQAAEGQRGQALGGYMDLAATEAQANAQVVSAAAEGARGAGKAEAVAASGGIRSDVGSAARTSEQSLVASRDQIGAIETRLKAIRGTSEIQGASLWSRMASTEERFSQSLAGLGGTDNIVSDSELAAAVGGANSDYVKGIMSTYDAHYGAQSAWQIAQDQNIRDKQYKDSQSYMTSQRMGAFMSGVGDVLGLSKMFA
jgi:hypothetical protein